MRVRRKAAHPKMKKEKGVWVYDSGRALTIAVVRKTTREIREESQRRVSGEPLPEENVVTAAEQRSHQQFLREAQRLRSRRSGSKRKFEPAEEMQRAHRLR
jgi:hypothetical protein